MGHIQPVEQKTSLSVEKSEIVQYILIKTYIIFKKGEVEKVSYVLRVVGMEVSHFSLDKVVALTACV